MTNPFKNEVKSISEAYSSLKENYKDEAGDMSAYSNEPDPFEADDDPNSGSRHDTPTVSSEEDRGSLEERVDEIYDKVCQILDHLQGGNNEMSLETDDDVDDSMYSSEVDPSDPMDW